MPSSKSSPRPKASDPLTPMRSVSFEAIGTHWTIESFQALSATKWRQLLVLVEARIEAFDRSYSRFRDDSVVAEMSRQAGTYKLPGDAQPMLNLYHDLYSITDGAMTPLIGSTIAAAGYDAAYDLSKRILPEDLPAPPKWEEVIEYDFPHLTLKRPVLLDFGAAGKGYLVDIIGALLQEHGVKDFCIDAGGDILYRMSTSVMMPIGLEHPGNPEQAIGVAQISNQSLCGSAGNRRAWGEYHHVIDAHSRTSPRHIKAVWVTAETALLADALTTALYFAPAKALARKYEFEFAAVMQDDSLVHSSGFPASFFTGETAA